MAGKGFVWPMYSGIVSGVEGGLGERFEFGGVDATVFEYACVNAEGFKVGVRGDWDGVEPLVPSRGCLRGTGGGPGTEVRRGEERSEASS